MNFKSTAFFFVLMSLLIANCARPKYKNSIESNPPTALGEVPSTPENSISNDTDLTTPGNPQATCELKFPISELCIEWSWTQKPSSNDEYGTIQLRTFNLSNNGDRVYTDSQSAPKFILWMPSMGHGSSPTVVTRQDIGKYLIEKVLFIMDGAWEFRIRVKLDDGQIDEVKVPYNFSSGAN